MVSSVIEQLTQASNVLPLPLLLLPLSLATHAQRRRARYGQSGH